jgi:LAGLIDADG-like domain
MNEQVQPTPDEWQAIPTGAMIVNARALLACRTTGVAFGGNGPMTQQLHPGLEAVPDRLKKLPVYRGYPVPWFVDWIGDVPEFRAMDGDKWHLAINNKLCWVCGEQLGRFMTFVVGPMCGINRTTSEPPCHLECAQWSVRNCFAGETKYWTIDGVKTFAETVGTTQKVLTTDGLSGGIWRDAEIVAFGHQRLWCVHLRCLRAIKTIYATANHRWIVQAGDQGRMKCGSRNPENILQTDELKPGQYLAWLLPRPRIIATTPSPVGIQHGVVFGDGSRVRGRESYLEGHHHLGSTVCLFGSKDAQLIRYFSEHRRRPRNIAGKLAGVEVLDLPNFFKERPSLRESPSYLYGWLAGYFAADGSVTKRGQAVLYSADLETLRFVQTVAAVLGIATWEIRSRMRTGFGESRPLHAIQFINSTLRPNFFLIRRHRERYEEALSKKQRNVPWKVMKVEPTDRVEEVFCAVVPGSESFTLDGWIHTKNCPFLSNPNFERRMGGIMEGSIPPAGFCLPRNPGVALLWTTRGYTLFAAQGGELIHMGEPTHIEWWALGKPATRAQVEESVRTGLPALQKVADLQAGAREELDARAAAFVRFYPSEAKEPVPREAEIPY